MRLLTLCPLVLLAAAVAPTSAALPRAAVFSDPQIHTNAAFARDLAELVTSAGYAAQFIDAATLTNAASLTPAAFPLLVLPQGRALPVEAIGPVQRFLQAGGGLMALGLPLWETPLFHVGDRWLSRDAYEQALARVGAEHPMFDFRRVDLNRWTRSTGPGAGPARHEIAPTDQGSALHARLPALAGWDTLASPPLEKPFPAGHTLTSFRAKGGPGATPLMVEWTERDGSRWIATVELTPEWKPYALPPAAFKAWTPPPGRGGKGDSLQPANAARLVLGVAVSHGAAQGSAAEYWITDMGTARNPFEHLELLAPANIPRLEALTPGYLFYPVSAPVEFVVPAVGGHEPSNRLKAGLQTLALHPRPGGAGYDQARPWRWEPLLEARASDGDDRGAVAAILVHARGGTVAAFTPNEPDFYRQEGARALLRQTAARIRRGLFLLEGGAEFFTLFTNQPVRLGAQVLNQNPAAGPPLRLRLSVTAAGPQAPPLFLHESAVSPDARSVQGVETNWLPSSWPARGCVVSVELLDGNQVLDRLSHELHVWQPKAQPHFIETRDGGFWLDGRPWKAHGVNYMPSSGIGVDGEHFEYWLGKGAYDPEVVERDLRRIKAMNLNAVSVFIYHRSLGTQHLLDFLRRCEALDLRVNLSLRPGTPLDFRWNEMKALIEYYRLAQHDTVFAYDLAWEPSHYDQAYQERHYTTLWQDWVQRRHSDLDAAKKAWGAGGANFKFEISSLKSLSVPTTQQISQDGPWRKLVADYRLFLDELLGPKYAEARRLVRTLDTRHAVSFRMQHAGDPTHAVHPLPYDFHGLRDAVDLWQPEAYGRIGDWERVKPGHFTVAYARLCDPAKPVLWAEMGNTVWDLHRMAPSPEKLAFTARYYTDFYRMLTESGADGVFFWWYPGGYRLNERSDFGIINPDGTDRAVTPVIRAEGLRFLSAPKPPPPNHWIRVDRDRDARGLAGLYEAVKAEYWRAIGEGRTPGLQWAKQPGR